MSRLLLILFMIAPFFNLSLMAQETEHRKEDKYILILNSHNYENSWGTGVSKSIRNAIEQQDPNVVVSISYAGISEATSFLAGRFGMQAAFSNGKISSNLVIPSVLILVGDESWMYYRIMNLRGRWENVPVILVDVHSEIMNDFSQFYSLFAISDSMMIPLEESTNNLPVTALVNRNNEAHTVELITNLMPDLSQIVFLSTGGYQDELALYLLKEVVAAQYPEVNLRTIYNKDERKMNAVQQELSSLPEHTAVILGTGKVPAQVNVPLFLLRDGGLSGHIVVGGCYPSIDNYALQVTDIAIQLYHGDSIASFPFTYVTGETAYLNKTALSHFGLEKPASKISGAVYRNIPDSFWVRHMRLIFLLLLLGVILVIIFILNLREEYYQTYVASFMVKYKKIHDEYQIVYENMPMGMAYFDSEGRLLDRNGKSNLFFEKVPAEEIATFNLFNTTMIDAQTKQCIAQKQLVDKVFTYNDRSLHLVFSYIQSEDENEILMIVLDYTAIQNEKAANKRAYSIFNFAMDASALGVAERNLIDHSLFATDAWYENLCNERGEAPADIYHAVVAEDRQKIEKFLANVVKGNQAYYADTIRVKKGDTLHWMQYVAQLLEYGPDDNRIIIAELVLNIDEQKQYEEELDFALKAAQESDRLKNAFIANMSCDMRNVLDELVILSNELIATEDAAKKTVLMASIEQNNELLLKCVEQIIELSKSDMTNKSVV